MTTPPRASRPSPHAQNNVGKDGEFAPELDDIDTMRAIVRAQDRRYQVVAEPRWPDGARIAVNFTADFDAMLLRRLLEEPPMQLAKGEFGGRVGVWRLLDLFDSHAMKTTLFVPGRIGELYPEAVRAWARSGHEVADHMWEHRVPADPATERAHLLRSTEALEKLSGRRPIGTRSWHSAELLGELGYLYNSHDAADHRPYFTEYHGGTRLMNLPFHYALDDAQFFSFAWLNTDNSAQRIADPDRVLELWWDTFWQQYQQGGYLNICLHPFMSGRSMRVAMLDQLITRMKELPGVWFASCEEVVRHCLSLEEER
ncbi:polysaccharide deacetylase family protein [Prauserella muralis]|nr:polysaccharide deacetylase family protein [Prauserella muralis]TWE28799.1 polysaccharide deacetylase [Prauserella muralis]